MSVKLKELQVCQPFCSLAPTRSACMHCIACMDGTVWPPARQRSTQLCLPTSMPCMRKATESCSGRVRGHQIAAKAACCYWLGLSLQSTHLWTHESVQARCMPLRVPARLHLTPPTLSSCAAMSLPCLTPVPSFEEKPSGLEGQAGGGAGRHGAGAVLTGRWRQWQQ